MTAGTPLGPFFLFLKAKKRRETKTVQIPMTVEIRIVLLKNVF